jgi:hypothetical protein
MSTMGLQTCLGATPKTDVDLPDSVSFISTAHVPTTQRRKEKGQARDRNEKVPGDRYRELSPIYARDGGQRFDWGINASVTISALVRQLDDNAPTPV